MIKKSIILMILLTLLTGCSSNLVGALFPKPKVVTEFSVQKVDIPDELLTPATPPNPTLLKDVKICKGSKELTKYGKDLIFCNYQNTQKLRAISELLK